MPPINEYKCNKCGLTLQQGWGYRFYVEDDKGDRIDCHHPSERRYVEQVLGENAPLELIRERTGFNSFCVCLDCLYQFQADLGESGWSPYEDLTVEIGAKVKQEKDKRECPQCNSVNVRTELELVGEACPKCKEGIIEETWTGRIS
ncbi:hypothetical protein ACFLT0_00340 [Chloroflexota bacterium]